jgi:hypothetical protein
VAEVREFRKKVAAKPAARTAAQRQADRRARLKQSKEALARQADAFVTAAAVTPVTEPVTRESRDASRNPARDVTPESRELAAPVTGESRPESRKESRDSLENSIKSTASSRAESRDVSRFLARDVTPPSRAPSRKSTFESRDVGEARPVTSRVTWRHVTWARFRAALQPSVIFCALLTVVFGSWGLYQSGAYAWSFGLTISNKSALAAATVGCEVIALVGLTIVASLWRHSRWLLAGVITAIWCAASAYAAVNAAGFNAANIDDTLAGRARDKNLQTAITVELERKRQKLNGMEAYEYTTPESVIAAQGRAKLQCPANKINSECRQMFIKLRAMERSRDLTLEEAALKADIRKLEGDLKTSGQAIRNVDPLADGIRRVTHDASNEAIENIRIGFLAFATFFASVFAAGVKSLYEANLAASAAREAPW